ncbi:MAG: hypothetical protein ACWGP1_16015 [Syntrophobacteria bacterium]
MATSTAESRGGVPTPWGLAQPPVRIQTIIQGHNIVTMAVSSALIAQPFHAPTECLLQPIEVSAWSEPGAIITQNTVTCTSFGMTAQAGGARVRALKHQGAGYSTGAFICPPVLIVWRTEYNVASFAITLAAFMECTGNPRKQRSAQQYDYCDQ